MTKITDIKAVVAANLVKYRKAAKLTQSQVAEKINYSDKAISKWERGEALPDVYVLKQIADTYGIDLEEMLHEETTKEKLHSFAKNKWVISLLSIILVWLAAMIIYVILEIIIPDKFPFWLLFIYAVPISFIIALIFNNLWGGRIYNMIIVSGINWGISISLVCSLNQVNDRIWYIYFISAVFEILTLVWYLLDPSKFKKKKQIEKSEETSDSTEDIQKNIEETSELNTNEIKPEDEITKSATATKKK